MTKEEAIAISVLASAVDSFRQDNRNDHEDIKGFIRDIKETFCQKIGSVGDRIDKIERDCEKRHGEVDNKIEAAKAGAVSLATAPSEGKIAAHWFAGKTKKLVIGIGAAAGVAVTVIQILEAIHVI